MQHERGVTLLDTVVGVSLMLVVFVGIAATFQLGVDVVANNKARASAVALLDERMEYLRSLPYASLGTVGGVPSGTLAQSESLTLNGMSFTRRTLIVYADDPKDGSAPTDTTPADYKAVKVDVSWISRTGTRDVYLVSRFEPTSGLESSVSGGILTINVTDSSSQPLQNAQVTITNASSSPTINQTTYTNTSGVVSLVGAPASSNYAVLVTKSGYSTAQTYSSSAQNTNPSPANLTVTNGQTTAQTFAIDVLSTFTIVTKSYADGSPITNAAVTLRGAKTIGTNPTVYKYSGSVGGSGSATTTVSNLEWDTYTMTINSATGYDLASSCAPQPVALPANSSQTVTLYLAPHTSASLPVKVTASASGALIQGASIRLYKTGYDTTLTTDSCGQAFFSGLSSGSYSMSVSKSGYTSYNGSNVNATSTVYQVSLN
ncbi:MAG TPA: carboxypeptidase-like regulatory domain-containing protein [Candidatus Paceibacterota bacterium]|nr:carboxypeptidase-like regulatory domain-containing protein [Candidatus Paceibacterota bacterium]